MWSALTLSEFVATPDLTLPLEIEEEVIGFLHNDPRSLYRCALVRREWVPRCRVLLYYNVTITTEDQFWAFVRTVRSQPYIRRLVRCIRFDLTWQKRRLLLNWVAENLLNIPGPELVNLNTLEFINLKDIWSYPSMYTTLAQWGSIRKLSLISCCMSSAESFYLIDAFPRLEVLYVDDFVNYRSYGRRVFGGIAPSFCLRCLKRLVIYSATLPECDDRETTILEWITKSPAKNTIEELYLGLSRRHLARRTRFISELGSNLRVLEIASILHFGQDPDSISGMLVHNLWRGLPKLMSAEILDSFTLDSNTELRSLTIPYPSHHVGLSLVSRVNAPKLERLNFRLNPFSMTWASEKKCHPEWDEGLEILLGTTLSSIQQVSILYHGQYSIDLMRDELPQLLPRVWRKVKTEVIPSPDRHEWF